MPSSLKRYHSNGDDHFLTFSCYRREPLLLDDALRAYFLLSLERLRSRHRLMVYGYVLMPEHVHLLVSEPRQIAVWPPPVLACAHGSWMDVDTAPFDSYSYPMSTLPSAINDLSITEKFELLDALWQDIEAHAPTLTDEQSAELDRRMAAYEQDPSAVIPWEQIKADLFNQ